MTDLVKRLRWLGDHASFEPHMHHTAADRIEKLEAALRMVIDWDNTLDWEEAPAWGDVMDNVSKALEGKDESI